MWFRKTSARREAIRADVAEATSQERLPRRHFAPVIMVAGVFFVMATAIQLWPGQPIPYRINDVAPITLVSPVSFVVTNPQETERMREASRATSPAVLVVNRTSLDLIQAQLMSLRQNIHGIYTPEKVPPEVAARFPGLTANALRDLNLYDPIAYATAVRLFVYDTLPHAPMVTAETLKELASRQSKDVKLAASGSLDTIVLTTTRSQVIGLGAGDDETKKTLHRLITTVFAQSLAEPLTSYLMAVEQPTYTLDRNLTALLAKENSETITANEGYVREGDPIIKRGALITPEEYRLLQEAQKASEKQTRERHPWYPLLAWLGQALAVTILTAAGTVYALRLGRFANIAGRGWSLAGLTLLTLLIARGTVSLLPHLDYLLGLAPTLLTAIVLVIVFNQRFALGMAALHGLLVTITLGQNIDFFLTLLTGVAVCCFGLNEIRTRGKLVEIGFLASSGMFVCTWALGLARLVGSIWNPWIVTSDIHAVGVHSLATAGSGLLVAMFALISLPLVEYVFKVTTALTLLELCDANRPLLRRLAQEASGTFNHSLTVGIMAEAAGGAIGANGLLCRVGAYYHDVGKLSKPQYFIENQGAGAPNRHEKLSPAMSLLIIVGHVKDGIELAREYALPWAIFEFISQHHGTTLVEYFYHAARKKQERGGEDSVEVAESEFRYPGPKPQSRETAIVMICDGCESIVRSIDDPTPGRVETVVHNLIMKRLLDGQFAECELTLRELSVIEETLVRTLAGIHHGRAAYPRDAVAEGPSVKLA
jgi:cyclic-di-AMP phosphodiesterase PgpH